MYMMLAEDWGCIVWIFDLEAANQTVGFNSLVLYFTYLGVVLYAECM